MFTVNACSESRKAPLSNPGSSLCHCSCKIYRHRGVVNGVGKVHFNAGIEPELTCASGRGLRGVRCKVFYKKTGAVDYVDIYCFDDITHVSMASKIQSVMEKIKQV